MFRLRLEWTNKTFSMHKMRRSILLDWSTRKRLTMFWHLWRHLQIHFIMRLHFGNRVRRMHRQLRNRTRLCVPSERATTQQCEHHKGSFYRGNGLLVQQVSRTGNRVNRKKQVRKQTQNEGFSLPQSACVPLSRFQWSGFDFALFFHRLSFFRSDE